jgi:hypothetical protein
MAPAAEELVGQGEAKHETATRAIFFTLYMSAPSITEGPLRWSAGGVSAMSALSIWIAPVVVEAIAFVVLWIYVVKT